MKILFILVIQGLIIPPVWSLQKRSRAESVPGFTGSNTVGQGNIWLQARIESGIRSVPQSQSGLLSLVPEQYQTELQNLLVNLDTPVRRDLMLVPQINGVLGLSRIMHLELDLVPWEGKKIGGLRAGLKLTTPKNDNLRLWGLGVLLDATLSTTENINQKDQSIPSFDPIPSVTLTGDLDLIKIIPSFPVKLYTNYSTMDEHHLSLFYKQHRLAFAFEYKGSETGWFVSWTSAIYQATNLEDLLGQDGKWHPTNFLAAGMRGKIKSRDWIFEIGLDPVQPMEFLKTAYHKSPSFSFEIQFPLYFKETQAEALRALMFYEQQRKKYRMAALQKMKKDGENVSDSTGVLDPSAIERKNYRLQSLDDEVLEQVFEENESKKSIQKRKKIREEIEQIEDLLE